MRPSVPLVIVLMLVAGLALWALLIFAISLLI
jgi:hypothetical protein